MADITLRDWANQHNKNYNNAYYLFKKDKIDGAYKNSNGIYVHMNQSPEELNAIQKTKNHRKLLQDSEYLPESVPMFGNQEVKASSNSSTSVRRNRATTITRSDKYSNIREGYSPYAQNSRTGVGGNYSASANYLNVKEPIELCQKAYYNISVIKNTIDLMTEFSSSDFQFKGGTKKSREFFTAWSKKTNLESFQDQFFREFYRSGNVFILRMDSKITQQDATKLTQVYSTKAAEKLSLPFKYTILNPSYIEGIGEISFETAQYFKRLTAYEIERLKHPYSEADKEIFENLPSEVKKQIKDKNRNTLEISIPLDPEFITAIFNKKQDYELFAVPMAFPVLTDINWKIELKKMDMAVSRTLQQAILLITMGESFTDGTINFNPKAVAHMQSLFQNESVARVLVADYTTKAEFILPDVGDILNPSKYDVVNKDIEMGLNNLFFGDGEKFSNQSIKIDVFLERLKEARKAFINNFLLPEIKRISKDMGFKKFPTPEFEKLEFKNDLEFSKMYVRMAELGLLTAEETVNSIETGILPTPEESVESQTEFKALKDKELYGPLVGGNKEIAPQSPGKPTGAPGPSKTKNTPIGGAFSLTDINKNLNIAEVLSNKVSKAIQKKFKLKTIEAQHQDIIDQISLMIMSNESSSDWEKKVNSYIKSPNHKNTEQVEKIESIACEHQVDRFMASVLFASQV